MRSRSRKRSKSRIRGTRTRNRVGCGVHISLESKCQMSKHAYHRSGRALGSWHVDLACFSRKGRSGGGPDFDLALTSIVHRPSFCFHPVQRINSSSSKEIEESSPDIVAKWSCSLLRKVRSSHSMSCIRGKSASDCVCSGEPIRNYLHVRFNPIPLIKNYANRIRGKDKVESESSPKGHGRRSDGANDR
jgi:hypothetical protein